MKGRTKPRIAVVWTQYGAYHIDRCEDLARRLAGRADLVAIEIATRSTDYAWKPSGEIAGMRKVTLFPGRGIEEVSHGALLHGLWRALKHHDMVLYGIGYGMPAGVIAAWLLRARGVRVVLLTDSKFDDKPRRPALEWLKRVAVLAFPAAIVAGRRQIDYARHLGFRRRPVLPGYDGVGVERIRREAGAALLPGGKPFADRAFVYVGRFIEKKNLEVLIAGYAAYAARAGAGARRLRLVGSGPLEPRLRQLVDALHIASLVDFLGFRDSEEVSRLLADSLALVLVSTEEQWGLVVNEAVAVGLPVIVSWPVGARDLLVREGGNGFIVNPARPEDLADAMGRTAAEEARWRAMSGSSLQRAWLGDCGRFTDAVELLLDPAAEPARARMDALVRALD